MIKNLVAPLQVWLLSKGHCVGCGRDLSKGVKKKVRENMTVTCQCGRIFVYNEKDKKYRRALFDEV